MILKNFPHFVYKKYGYWSIKRGMKQNVDTITKNYTDFEFPVGWGTIRGKLWGSKDKQPILAIHGWMDNASSFDLLAPLLKNSSILAIDLPGHGFSSWIPKGILYDENTYLLILKSIANHFAWNKIKLIGHSLGGIICFLYTQLFPEEVEFVISIDSLGCMTLDEVKYVKMWKKSIVDFTKFEKKNSTTKPTYSKREVLQRRIDANKQSDLDFSATEILLQRGALKQNDGKYSYTRDFRLNYSVFNFYTDDIVNKFSKNITCPYLVLRARKSQFKKEQYWNNVGEVLSKTSKDFRIKILDGCHHMHMMKPQMVADEINPFLEKYNK